MKTDLLRKKLLYQRKSDTPKVIAKRVARNRALAILSRYGAIKETLEVEPEKVSPQGLIEVKNLLNSLSLPMTTVSPAPRKNELFNITYLDDRGPLYIELFGGNNVDVDVWELVSTTVERAYKAKISWVKENEIVQYKGKSKNKLSKITRDGIAIGLMYRVSDANNGRKQIRVDLTSEKILVQYRVNRFTISVWVFCPQEFKKVARETLGSHERLFAVEYGLIPRDYFRVLQRQRLLTLGA